MALRPTRLLNLIRNRTLATIALGVAIVAIAAACESLPPTATPTPTPTPTPVPLRIQLDQDSTVGDIISSLKEAEVACIEEELDEADYRALLEQPVLGDTSLSISLPIDCLDQDTVAAIVVAGLDNAAGGLSDASATCIRSTFASIDLAAFADIDASSGDLSAFDQVFGAALGLLLCLNDEEAARIDASGAFGDTGGLTLVQLRCVVEQVDLTALLAGGGDPTAFLGAFEECGVDLGAFGLGDALGDLGDLNLGDLAPTLEAPDLSGVDVDALTACLRAALGDDAFNEIISGQRLPDFTELGALSSCDLDLSQLGDLSTLGGA